MLDRRKFIAALTGGLLASSLLKGKTLMAESSIPTKTKVSIVKTPDRKDGIPRAIDLLKKNPVKGKKVLLKPNFNTADPYPASTHNDTLANLILKLKDMDAAHITIGERSGPPDTSDVMKEKGIYELAKKMGVELINFEELKDKDWVRITPKGSHWRNGFLVARPVIESECVVSTCCLKTHGYGGVFTMSLKLSVGLTHKKNMTELHTSFINMRRMIAEINQAYAPSLILMDGIEAFTDKGPSSGTVKRADAIVAGTDRIAVDAVGIAILKHLGSNKAIMDKKIFEQEQIARAVELGLGVSGPEHIELVFDDEAGRKFADEIKAVLLKG